MKINFYTNFLQIKFKVYVTKYSYCMEKIKQSKYTNKCKFVTFGTISLH